MTPDGDGWRTVLAPNDVTSTECQRPYRGYSGLNCLHREELYISYKKT